MSTPLDIDTLLSEVISRAETLGVFSEINGHEPKSAPGQGVTAAVWAQEIDPVPGVSGLGSTSVRVGLMWRLYTPMLSLAPDSIDPAMLKALDALCGSYSAGFTLDGAVMEVDLLGSYGDPMRARAGYLNQDGTMFRVLDLTVPLIVPDLWTQEA
jgi:hypothetical protein